MKTPIIAMRYEHARMVARSLGLTREQWIAVSNEEALRGMAKGTRVLVAEARRAHNFTGWVYPFLRIAIGSGYIVEQVDLDTIVDV